MDDELTTGLRRALEATSDGADAAHGVPHPDRADLDRRIRRRARRRTALAASLGAALLVAGAVGGAAVASSSDDDRAPVAAGGGTVPPTTSPGVSVPDDPRLPVVEPDLRISAQRSAATSWSSPSADYTDLRDGSAGSGWGSADRPSTTIFRRTTPDGTHLDVRANRYAGAADGTTPEPYWSAPGWCAPSGELYVGVRSASAVGQVRGSRYGEVRAGSIVAIGSVVGVAEGEPRWVLVAQVPPTVADVRVTFPDGHRDHLAPVGSVVVLTARVADGFDLDALGPGLSALRIDAVDARGDSVATVTGSDQAALAPVAPGDPSCQPPADLPPAGAEQPADPTAARTEIDAAWASVFTTPLTDGAALEAIDDPSGVAAARADLARRYPQDRLGGTANEITDLVFTDASTAVLRYRVTVPAYGYDDPNHYGEVRLVDGRWKLTRATVCSLYAQGGAACGAP